MLLPALSRAKVKANTVGCISNLRQMGATTAMYAGDNQDRFQYSGRDWPQMPFVDWFKLSDAYIRTNNRAFYRCPGDKEAIAWNYWWVRQNGSSYGITTNNLPFPTSYYYLYQFYMSDPPTAQTLQPRRATEVRSPAKKALMECEAEPGTNGDPGGGGIAHGKGGVTMLFVDSHAAYVRTNELHQGYLANQGQPYNLDWTIGGLAGEDLK